MSSRHHKHDDSDNNVPLKETLKSLIAYVRKYRKSFIMVIFIMLLYAILDSAVPLITKYAIDNYIHTGNKDGIHIFFGFCLTFAALRGYIVRMLISTGGVINTGVAHDLRRDCFHHLQKLSFSYFDQRPAGWILSRMTSDTTLIGRSMSWSVADLVETTGKITLISVIMLILNVKLALIVMICVPILAFLVFFFQAKTMFGFRKIRQLNSELTASFNEGIAGAKTSKTLVRESENINEFTEIANDLYDESVKAAFLSSFYLPGVFIVSALGISLTLITGGKQFIGGEISAGTIVAFIGYATSFYQPLQDLARRFPQLQNTRAAAERLFSLLSTPVDIRDSCDVVQKYICNNEKLPEFKGDICFDNVDFSYKEDELILKKFNLHINPGQVIAIVGPTGAGKSTIVNLLCRFYDPTSGSIKIDGIDIKDLPLRWMRDHLAIVQQPPHLFNASIIENIRYAKPDATDEEVRNIAEQACSLPCIEELPEGFNYKVGEGGDELSSGVKQLIALTRTMLASPDLLILDEATSSIDVKTEQNIQKSIEQLLKGRTSIIIAHRLSTIRSANRILYIDKGEIVEAGTHKELLALKGRYYKLYTGQFIEERETRLFQQH